MTRRNTVGRTMPVASLATLAGWKRGTVLMLGVLVGAASTGCGGYFPLRWPSKDMWTPSHSVYMLEPPSSAMEADVHPIHKHDVFMTAEFFSVQRTQAMFGRDLLGKGIRPLLLVLANESPQAYQFSKAQLDPHYIPAAEVARAMAPHLIATVLAHLKWVALFIPGLIVESVIEPTTTLDFPVIEEAVRRPSTGESLKDDLLKIELADGVLEPHSSRAGFVFVPPVAFDTVKTLTLIDAKTQQPLVLEISTPPRPSYVNVRAYSKSYDVIWETVTTTAARVWNWKVTSADKTTGRLAIHKGRRFLWWNTTATMTVAVQPIRNPKTQQTVIEVRLESPFLGFRHDGEGIYSRSIDRFFKLLDEPVEAR